MWTHNLNPVILSLGPLEVRWYGLMYVLSFIVIYLYARAAVKKKTLKITLKDLDDLMIWLVAALIIGARLGEIIFYNPSYYIANPSEIIAIWHGGLSFHGGLIGVLIAGYAFSRKKKISFLQLCDVFVVPLALAQVFGRIGNFINGELYGRVTSLPWGVKFPSAEGFRHPSQLYEAAYNLVIFGFLFFQRNLKRKPGYLLGWFLILYSVFRFLTEYVREPELMIGPLTMGQCLNIPMFIAGVYLLYRIRK
ncbi:prolipoprotein diacylglyceryl transferase [Candidatus Woesearchaeota archaeon]|nr:prolipoprotein diacylglyceryl transferase [Candidatus Woesearchaeota archaeon]MBW3005769.1 prolipoprotein diacylglyceryl transferase [Candidatus Woesearchaeota archaeon]